MQKQYDTLPTGLPEWDGTGIDDFDLPDYMFKDPIHYSEEWFNFIEEKVKDENLADEYKQIMINIMHKKHGVDVRLSLTIFIYIIAHGFTVAVDEFSSLSKLIQDRVSELEKEYEALLNEWKNTIGGLTVDSEVINARTTFKGIVFKTLKERLDAMETSHFTIVSGEADVVITLQDDKFSQNHVLVKEKEVDDPSGLSGLIIAEVDNPIQDTFYFEKVGEI